MNRAVVRIIAVQVEESSMSQEELARKVGVGQSTISRLLRSETPMTLDHFEAFCKALRLVPSEVISDAAR